MSAVNGYYPAACFESSSDQLADEWSPLKRFAAATGWRLRKMHTPPG
jgi:hypothetical protein